MSSSTGLTRLQNVTAEKLRVARRLRKNMTSAEALLWKHLRNRKCGGYKFRLQQVIEGFVADFYCEAAKLAIEVDGGVHTEKKQKEIDKHRMEVFISRGINTIRFTNDAVFSDLSNVLFAIAQECRNRLSCSCTSLPSPLGEWPGVRSKRIHRP